MYTSKVSATKVLSKGWSYLTVPGVKSPLTPNGCALNWHNFEIRHVVIYRKLGCKPKGSYVYVGISQA